MMSSRPCPFDPEAKLGTRRAIIRRNPDDPSETEMIEAVWGSNPRFTGGINYRFVRAEGKTFPSNRCLIPASEFHMSVRGKHYRAALDSGNFFYLAGVWEPAMDGWPVCFRIITVYASSDVSDYQERHGAIIQRRQVMQWLDSTVPEDELLIMPPERTLRVAKIGKDLRQGALRY